MGRAHRILVVAAAVIDVPSVPADGQAQGDWVTTVADFVDAEVLGEGVEGVVGIGKRLAVGGCIEVVILSVGVQRRKHCLHIVVALIIVRGHNCLQPRVPVAVHSTGDVGNDRGVVGACLRVALFGGELRATHHRTARHQAVVEVLTGHFLPRLTVVRVPPAGVSVGVGGDELGAYCKGIPDHA